MYRLIGIGLFLSAIGLGQGTLSLPRTLSIHNNDGTPLATVNEFRDVTIIGDCKEIVLTVYDTFNQMSERNLQLYKDQQQLIESYKREIALREKQVKIYKTALDSLYKNFEKKGK